jgi:hypothetical protein
MGELRLREQGDQLKEGQPASPGGRAATLEVSPSTTDAAGDIDYSQCARYSRLEAFSGRLVIGSGVGLPLHYKRLPDPHEKRARMYAGPLNVAPSRSQKCAAPFMGPCGFVHGQATPDLKTRKGGYIGADPETLKTSKVGVFGVATVILAMGAGRKAATAIDEYLRSGVW